MKTRSQKPEVRSRNPGRLQFDRVMAIVTPNFPAVIDLHNRFENDDESLIYLGRFLAEIGRHTMSAIHAPGQDRAAATAKLHLHLSLAAAFCLAWIFPDDREPQFDSLSCRGQIERVWAERERQRRLMREGKIIFACESPIVDARRKYRVLAEEVGEVAHAIDQVERATRHERTEAQPHLENELVQVAAVAVAWLEALAAGTLNPQPSTLNHP